MTLAISYESHSSIIEADEHSELRMTAHHPHSRFVRIEEPDGTIRLVPFELLDEAERAIMENHDLYVQTRRGLDQLVEGKYESSDWLFTEE